MKKKKYNSALVRALAIVAFLLIWQGYTVLNGKFEWINPVFLPGPADVFQTMVKYLQDGSLWKHVSASLARVGKGYCVGILIAIILGYFMARINLLNDILDPILGLFGSIPPYAFCPLFIIWFGIGENSKVFLITYCRSFKMYGNREGTFGSCGNHTDGYEAGFPSYCIRGHFKA